MELISVHVPKTAGVTFRSLLQRVYGTSAVAMDYQDRALDPASTFQSDPARWRMESAKQAAACSPSTRVIHGHFGGAKYDEFFPAVPKIVWLRDPVARLVSHYHYWRSLPSTPHTLHRLLLEQNLSLLAFARLDGMRNILARVFLRDCRLEDFAFVGLQERFAVDLRRLAEQFAWPVDLPILEENKNRDAGYQAKAITAEEHAEIAALNAEDIALYQQASEVRHEV